MRIHTKTVIDMATSEILEDEYYEYDGPIAEAKGGGGGTTTVQQADPWSGAQPYLMDYMQQAQDLSQTPMEQFGGTTTLPYSAGTLSGMEALRGVGGAGSLTGQAQEQLGRTLGGEFLGMTPELQRGVIDPVLQSVGSQFEKAGRYGSPAQAEAAARGATGALAPYYEAERGRMQQAIGAAPGMEMAGISPQLQVGGMEEAKLREQLGEEMGRFQFEQQEPLQRLQRYASLVSPGAGFGGTTTGTSQMPGGSTASNMLAGGMMGSMIPGALGGFAGAAGPMAAPALMGMGPLGWGLLGAGALGLMG